MNGEQLLERIKTIMCREDWWRIQVIENDLNDCQLQLDFHGLTKTVAKRYLKNVIALNPFPFRINAIHGFNNGTKIKEMLCKEQVSDRISKKYSLACNPGMTYICVSGRAA